VSNGLRTARGTALCLGVLGALCLSACTLPRYSKPPPDPAGGLFLLERDLFAAVQKKDMPALERMVAEEFLLRQQGQPDQDRKAFLAGVQSIPGTLEVMGEGLDARVLGDLGIITGIQRSKAKFDNGRMVEDVQVFTDIVVFRDGRWQLAMTHSNTLAK